MKPLLESAQNANNLAWTLRELGEHLSTQALRQARRLSIFIAPLCLVAIGALVALAALGFFMPLVAILDGLST
jgi:type II secretory pathway component PulF